MDRGGSVPGAVFDEVCRGVPVASAEKSEGAMTSRQSERKPYVAATFPTPAVAAGCGKQIVTECSVGVNRPALLPGFWPGAALVCRGLTLHAAIITRPPDPCKNESARLPGPNTAMNALSADCGRTGILAASYLLVIFSFSSRY
jgi:hypothetical protein